MYEGRLTCFKAYDIRGAVPGELNSAIAYRIGSAYAKYLRPRHVVVGHDIRHESPEIAASVARGLNHGGVDVIDIGLCGTEEVYFATVHRQADGGIMVTASHNPKGHSGMKLVRASARPISTNSGLDEIRRLVEEGCSGVSDAPESQTGVTGHDFDKTAYVSRLLSFVDISALKPLRIVVNPGNGGAGAVVRLLERHLPFAFSYLHERPDGTFPNGVPNPLLPENRAVTARAVLEHRADLGVAWDGDFDRCFFFDANGRFIEGYYLVGLLAEVALAKNPGSKIIHDPRLTWNTIEQVRAAGGTPVQSRTGHAFIKERMRTEDAAYGGEMSAHHYFRDFAYCDTGMVPWLLVTELMSRTGQSLAELVDDRMARFPCSGEINYRVLDVPAALEHVLAHYLPSGPAVDRTDGIGVEFSDWRFNLRGSNTEPMLRLNVETRADPAAVAVHVGEIEKLIKEMP